MSKCHLLLPIFTFSLGKLWCQLYPKKCWCNKNRCVFDSPLPALAEAHTAPGAQLISMHCPQSGHVLQGTDIGKRLHKICQSSSNSEANVLNRLMEPPQCHGGSGTEKTHAVF